MSSTTNIAGIAERYATALYDLADEEKLLDAVAKDLAGLKKVLAECDDLSRLLRSPLFSREEQMRGLMAVLDKGKAQPLTRRFLGIVGQHRRLFALRNIIEGFQKMLAERRGQISATVTSAVFLTEAQISALKTTFKSALGRDVDMEINVDPDLIGGLVVKVGSRMIDSSLRTKLQNLQYAMKEVG